MVSTIFVFIEKSYSSKQQTLSSTGKPLFCVQRNKMHFLFIVTRRSIISLYSGLDYFKEFSVNQISNRPKKV